MQQQQCTWRIAASHKDLSLPQSRLCERAGDKSHAAHAMLVKTRSAFGPSMIHQCWPVKPATLGRGEFEGGLGWDAEHARSTKGNSPQIGIAGKYGHWGHNILLRFGQKWRSRSGQKAMIRRGRCCCCCCCYTKGIESGQPKKQQQCLWSLADLGRWQSADDLKRWWPWR